MADSGSIDRRKFLKVCVGTGAAVAANPSLIAEPAGELVPAERVRLVDGSGQTLLPEKLTVGKSYIFHYPYVTTPCFLIDLGVAAEPGEELTTSDGNPYRWSGGVGPGRSIVAFSAICAHRMSYPTRSVSFIDYRHEPMSETDIDSGWWARGQVIYCAPQPLAAVSLEYDAEGQALFATGIYGGDMLDKQLRSCRLASIRGRVPVSPAGLAPAGTRQSRRGQPTGR
jgi:Rieske Fe-S protein